MESAPWVVAPENFASKRWKSPRPAVKPTRKESAASAARKARKPDQLRQEVGDSGGVVSLRSKLNSAPAFLVPSGTGCTPVGGWETSGARFAARTETIAAAGRTGELSGLFVKVRTGATAPRVAVLRVGVRPMNSSGGGGGIRATSLRREAAGASPPTPLAKTQSRICCRARSGRPMNRIPACIFVSLVHAISARVSIQSRHCGNWNRTRGR